MSDQKGFSSMVIEQSKQHVAHQAMDAAERAYAAGNTREAEHLCREWLREQPGNPDALLLLGRVMHRRGRSDMAIALMKQAVAANPLDGTYRYRLGKTLHDCGRNSDALSHLQTAHDLDPQALKPLYALAAALLGLNRPDEAESWLRQALDIRRDDPRALFDLANLLLATDRSTEATETFAHLMRVAPELRQGHHALAIDLERRGQVDRAIQVLRWGLFFQPNDPELAFMLAAMSQESSPDRAPDDYIIQHFDRFSEFFDTQLREKLEYRAPEFVVDAAQRHAFGGSDGSIVLDAGCGTGLCGPLLKPFTQRLVGVDLSPGMIEKARERLIYDELAVAELTDYLFRHRHAFDTIVSADVLVYFGDLRDVFRGATEALKPGGFFIATYERGTGLSFQHTASGRYAHSSPYLYETAVTSGLHVLEIQECHLRQQWGNPVAGYLMTVHKPMTTR